jgi:hypothetical protein
LGVQGHPGQKVFEPPSQQMTGYNGICRHLSDGRKCRLGGLQFRQAAQEKVSLYLKNNHSKRAGMAQAVEHLPSKCVALSSNSSTALPPSP